MRLIITLQPKDIELLKRPIRGSGGWQILLRRIQDQVDGNEVILEVKDVGKILRYAQKYGSGGFEDRLQAVLEPLIQLAEAMMTSLRVEQGTIGQLSAMRSRKGRTEKSKRQVS